MTQCDTCKFFSIRASTDDPMLRGVCVFPLPAWLDAKLDGRIRRLVPGWKDCATYERGDTGATR